MKYKKFLWCEKWFYTIEIFNIWGVCNKKTSRFRIFLERLLWVEQNPGGFQLGISICGKTAILEILFFKTNVKRLQTAKIPKLKVKIFGNYHYNLCRSQPREKKLLLASRPNKCWKDRSNGENYIFSASWKIMISTSFEPWCLQRKKETRGLKGKSLVICRNFILFEKWRKKGDVFG